MQVFQPFTVASLPPEFVLFGLTLLGIALFHHHTMKVALCGLLSIVLYKILFTSFDFAGLFHHEAFTLFNLFLLLMGFGLLARHFQQSRIPTILPHYLPDDWKGGLLLLLITFLLSSFLDNIAAAMIGAAMALSVFKGKVHIGYMAAIVAASNAGGAGSVIGDTTTTMMWIEGVPPLKVLHAYIGSGAAFLVFGVAASLQQQKFSPIRKEPNPGIKPDSGHLFIALLILAGAIITNLWLDFPALGVWVAIVIGAFFRKTDWNELRIALPGTIFLLSLVLAASMMPVESLPKASWLSAFVLGFVSSVFDNIPLTKLALVEGGFDWGILAYCVGFGGSMIWFGSSAGVALTNLMPEGRSVGRWLMAGWHVVVGYIIGFIVLLALAGWHPVSI
jgi:Na+/H+ antiporter NhaD/arsenite permease-like protein